MCRAVRAAMAEFYRDPVNERRFKEWRDAIREGDAPKPASTARVPVPASGRPSPT